MLVSPNDLGEQPVLTCEVCIVGGGAAGITLARELSNRRVDTICVSGGGLKPRAADQELFRGHIPDPAAHEPLEENRVRAFGGSTTLWGGRLVPFDPIDFESRDFVPLSGWPIRYDEMARYIPRAAAICESPQHNFDIAVENSTDDLPARLGRNVVTNRGERWSMPTNFAERYAAELRQSENVRVLVDQHCTDIELDETLTSVQRVSVRPRGGSPRWINAHTFVLACGGLENPRLLLAARRQMPDGIGNQHDMVGRCYMGHIAGTHGHLRMEMRGLPAFYQLAKDEHGMYVRRRFWLTEDAQRANRLMNIIAFPLRPDPADPAHGDPVLSLVYIAGRHTPQGRNGSLQSSARHLRNVFWASPFAWSNAAAQLWRRFHGWPRLPFVLPYHRRNRDAIFFQSEHAPNRESRLVLSNERDEFGMPRLEPRIAFSEIDTETVVRFFAILDRGLRELGFGRIEYTEPELREYLSQVMQQYCSHAHHVGTTRMAADAHDGVVDADCRVHGIQNLYISGSSIFPTSGHANPTLTLLAMTLRLADCLVASRRDAAIAAC